MAPSSGRTETAYSPLDWTIDLRVAGVAFHGREETGGVGPGGDPTIYAAGPVTPAGPVRPALPDLLICLRSALDRSFG